MSKSRNACFALLVTLSFAAIADQPDRGRTQTEPTRLQQEDRRESPALRVLPRPTQLSAPRSHVVS